MCFRFVLGLLVLTALVAPSLSPQPTEASTSLHHLYGSGSQTGGRPITLRVELTEPAAQGGVDVALSVSDPAIKVPASVHVGTGQTEKLFTVKTSPVLADTNITVTAQVGGVSKSRVVLLRATNLKAFLVQSVIRHGGIGRIMIVLSGPAPSGGFPVQGTSSPSGIVQFGGTYTVPAGKDRLIISAVTNLMGLASDTRLPAQTVTLAVQSGATTLSSTVTVRDFGDDPRPTSTPTNTPTETATPTDSPTSTPTNTPTETATPTETPTSTATSTSTNTPTSTATSTATATPTITNTPKPLSSGCSTLNNSAYDGTYWGAQLIDLTFFVGEVITITGSNPQATGATHFVIDLGTDTEDLAFTTGTFGTPATITITSLSSSPRYTAWYVYYLPPFSGPDLTDWTVSCTAP